VVRYLGVLNESNRNIVELQCYTTFDEVCSLAYKVELQKKAKFKREPPTPPQRTHTFNKGSLPSTPKPINPPTAPSFPKPNSSKPPVNPFEKRRYYKCQGFRHSASDCPNRKFLTLVEYQMLEEAELREVGSDKEIHLMEFEEECMEEVDEGESLVLRRALNGHKVSNREEQHENIFST